MIELKDKKIDKYFCLFNTIITGNIKRKINPAVDKYLTEIYRFVERGNIENKIQIEEEVENKWKEYLKANNLSKDKSQIIEIKGGNYFGLSVSIMTIVYGPI